MFFGPSLELLILPQHVVLGQPRRRFGRSAQDLTWSQKEESSERQPAWTAEIAACTALLARAGAPGRLRVVVSDVWSHHAMLPVGETVLSDQEAMALAKAHFANRFADSPAAKWPLRLARQGNQLLISAMDVALLDAIHQMAKASGRRIAQITTLFAHVFDRHAPELSRRDGWMLLDEPGMLIAACMARGHLHSWHGQRIGSAQDDARATAAQVLLDRQSALQPSSSRDVWTFAYPARVLGLDAPWRVLDLHAGGISGRAQA